MTTKKICITAIGMTIALCCIVSAAETVAVVLKVTGEVSVTKSGQTSQDDAKRGTRLDIGDKVVTGDKSFVAFRFIDDASLVRIGAQSTCIIEGEKERRSITKRISVEAGTIFTRVTGQQGRFQVATPTSVASVKGTQFITEHQDVTGSRYFGEEGQVEVSNDAGTVMLGPGQTAIVTAMDAVPIVRQTQSGEKPAIGGDMSEDTFEFDFEKAGGERKTLRFNAKKK